MALLTFKLTDYNLLKNSLQSYSIYETNFQLYSKSFSEMLKSNQISNIKYWCFLIISGNIR